MGTRRRDQAGTKTRASLLFSELGPMDPSRRQKTFATPHRGAKVYCTFYPVAISQRLLVLSDGHDGKIASPMSFLRRIAAEPLTALGELASASS